MPLPRIDVKFPTCAYPIHIERRLIARLGELVRAVAPHQRTFLFVDQSIAESHGPEAIKSLKSAGYEVAWLPISTDEAHKTLEVANQVYRELLRARFERQSPIIALGGGIVGDLAGFVAATYLRGVPLIQVPTTLLAMVDASIGGKVGVNFPLPDGTLGKNLIGAFHQPKAVIADPEVLRTLPPRDFRCGLAECIKHGLIADPDLLTFIEARAEQILSLEMDILTELIERCARIKVGIVQEDEREQGRRALLNLGHTFAHVIEPLPQLDLRHGEAVAIGLVAAMACAVATNRLNQRQAAQVRALIERVGLPSRLPTRVPMEPLIKAMGYDKKVVDGKLRLVLPRGLGGAEIVNDLPRSMIEAAWREVGAE